jgi:diguanylate cyclase
MIIKELFSNLTILVSILFIYSQATRNFPLNRDSSLSRKILTGMLGGLLSNILMQYSLHFDSIIVDLRHIPIILLSYYGGSIPALITMVLVIVGRFLIGINLSSFAAIAFIIPITIVSILISNSRLTKRVKIFSIVSFSNLIFLLFFYILTKETRFSLIIIPVYWSVSYLAGFMSFYIVEYLRNSQMLFNRYKSESYTDGLTGLNNVRKFDEIFNSLIKTVKNKNEKLSLLYIDIDFFKKINDTYGHKEGDLVLKELGNILKSSARSFDIVSRNGGEEFTVILLDCPLTRAIEISERIKKTVEKYRFTLSSSEQISITISIGIACFNETTNEATALIKDADAALYKAKRTGRNKVCVFDQ